MSHSKPLFKSVSAVSIMTLLSRIMGFIRDVIIAHVFGASGMVDAFLVAFKIPNFMRRLFAEGAFSQAFVPVLTEYQTQKPLAEVKRFVDQMAGVLCGVLLLITLIVVIAAPKIVLIFAPGFYHDSTRLILTSQLLRITFPYLLFISLTAFTGAILNTLGNFVVPAFTPVLLNICLIASAFLLAPFSHPAILALAIGVFIAGIVQLTWQIAFLWRQGWLPIPRIAWRDSGVLRVFKLVLPALFGVSVAQINLMLGTLFASFLVSGSVSWLYYADRLTSFPLGIFGIAIATVILPRLARQHQADDAAFSLTLDWAIRTALLIGVPAAVGLFMLAGPLLATLFQYGQFSAFDVLMTRQSLMAFAVGIPAFMLIKILASAFYAKQNIATPVRIAMISIAANIIFNLILVSSLKHAGLALATAISAIVNASLLGLLLFRQGIFKPAQGWLKYAMSLVAANGTMAVVLCYGRGELTQWLLWSGVERGWHLLLLMLLAMASYFGCLFLTGWRVRVLWN